MKIKSRTNHMEDSFEKLAGALDAMYSLLGPTHRRGQILGPFVSHYEIDASSFECVYDGLADLVKTLRNYNATDR